MDRGYSTHSRNLMNETLEKEDQAVMTQLKKAYWTTKQQIKKTLGKKEDESIVASDAELDAKLELFKEIKISSLQLLKVLLDYQKRLVILAREENAMGKFLKQQAQEDHTQAGKIMSAVGKSQVFCAQHRILLRQPLYRLFQEVETFRIAAIVDTQQTVNKMEDARTEYRGALMWMKDVSERLDPDAYNRLEKFRKVQVQVKKAKETFDKHNLSVMQKVDLLAASRSNMFSHALAAYQNTLVSFWQKTAKTMNAVSETFKGFQYYEFNMLKSDLDETTKELARQTASERTEELLSSLLEDVGHNPRTEEDKLIYDIIMSLQDQHKETKQLTVEGKSPEKSKKSSDEMKGAAAKRQESVDSSSGLLDLDEQQLEHEAASVDEQFGEFQAAMDKETKEFSLMGAEAADKYSALRSAEDDLLDDIFGPEQPPLQTTLEQLTLGNSSNQRGAASAEFLFEDLLGSTDLSGLELLDAVSSTTGTSMPMTNLMTEQGKGLPPPPYTQPVQGAMASSTSKTSQPKSNWYNLFADLDPLADPDSVGKQKGSGMNDGCA